jgi:hypothetical protein
MPELQSLSSRMDAEFAAAEKEVKDLQFEGWFGVAGEQSHAGGEAIRGELLALLPPDR